MWSQPSNLSSKFMPISEVSQIRTNLHIYKTPIKQTLIYNNQNYTNPHNYDLNYFGTLFSSGNLIQKQQEQINQSPFIQNKDYNFFLKSSLEKSNLKITPGSEYKIHNNENNNKNICNKNIKTETKKNLYEIFNSVKNENLNNINNSNLFISPQNKIKRKTIFECSASTNNESLSSLRKKKRRARKNREQLKYLSLFYHENKHWTKEQIKKISEEIGLKENKVYKWLWDQKNKEYKSSKFVVTNNKTD
jgi:hypothetical protein